MRGGPGRATQEVAAGGGHGVCQAAAGLGLSSAQVRLNTENLQTSSSTLFSRKKGESLRQVEKFFLCVRAVMSMHLRSMCIKTLEDFIDYMRTYKVSFVDSFDIHINPI